MIKLYGIRDYDTVMALLGPKHVWFDGLVIRVFTGADIPPPPPPMPVMIEEKVALDALVAAGKTPAEARTLLDAAAGATVKVI